MTPARATPRPFRFDAAVDPGETRYSHDGVGERPPDRPAKYPETVEHAEHTESN